MLKVGYFGLAENLHGNEIKLYYEAWKTFPFHLELSCIPRCRYNTVQCLFIGLFRHAWKVFLTVRATNVMVDHNDKLDSAGRPI